MTQLTSNQTGVLSSTSATWSAKLADWAQLTKPRITIMVALTTYLGYAMAEPGGAFTFVLAATLMGTALSCMGASALNQYVEQDCDALMPRTQNRPLPTGRMAPHIALLAGTLLAVLGVAVLALWTNLLTASLSIFTILSYVFIYTPLKRITSVSTIVGAVPGALPPVMGYTAATGQVQTAAVLMFAIMFLWQLPHFLAIAWLYRDDYARASMPMLPVIDPTGASTFRQMIIGCTVLLPLGLMPTMMGLCGSIYFFGAFIAGIVFLFTALLLMFTRSRIHARWAFFVSLIYLPTVFTLMLIDQV